MEGLDSITLRREKMDVRIAFVVTPTEKKYIEEAINKGGFRKASDFYREAIIDKVTQILES